MLRCGEEPVETELAKQVEYDMDDIDREWLDQVNAQRRREGSDAVSYEFFEVIIDRLEKEWFDLVRHSPKLLSRKRAQTGTTER